MKSIISKIMGLLAVAATLFSFTNLGGEGFEIFLNNKVVIQQFGKPTNVKSLKLDQYSANDQLTVKYHHCGELGRSRVITIKDGQNKLLKEWRFADVAASIATPVSMTCSVKDILNLSKGEESRFKLYYTCSELPQGRLLAKIVVERNSVAITK